MRCYRKSSRIAVSLVLVMGGMVLIGSVGARASSVLLTNATLFRGDSGSNQGGSGTAHFGAWTTVLDQQNVPGNYGAELFLSTKSNPGPSDFLSPSAALSLALNDGDNTFYFFGDGDDMHGGTDSFGLNLFLNNAGTLNPNISAYVAPGSGNTAQANPSTSTTVGYDFSLTPGAGTLGPVSVGGSTITLTDFEVLGVGGASGNTVDLVNSTNTAPFTPPPAPDGITDTYGVFTIHVSTPSVVPLPASCYGAIGLILVGGIARGIGRRMKMGK